MDKIKLIKKMCSDNPESAELLYLLGIEYKEAGMFKDSITTFSDSLKIAQGDLFEKIMKEVAEVGARNAIDQENCQQKNNKISFDDSVFKVNSLNSKSEAESNNSVNEETSENIRDNTRNIAVDDFENKANDELEIFRVIKGGSPAKIVNLKGDGASVTTFEDVGGLEDLKKSIRMKIIKPFLTPSLFEKFKKKSGGGLLLFGPPGCGKTFIARATAGECSATFKPVHITDVLDPYFGQSARNIKDIFSVARAQKPCILFFDEIDTIGFNRAKSSTDMMRSIVDQLLSEIEGIDTNTERILIIGATNMPWDIDPALRRPGRFDRTIFVSPPDLIARETIFKLKMRGKPCDNINYKLLAKESELFSGADIENVIEVATENVLEEILSTGDERNLKQDDLLNALKSVKPSTVEWLRTISNYVKYSNQSGLYDDVEAYLSKHRKLL